MESWSEDGKLCVQCRLPLRSDDDDDDEGTFPLRGSSACVINSCDVTGVCNLVFYFKNIIIIPKLKVNVVNADTEIRVM